MSVFYKRINFLIFYQEKYYVNQLLEKAGLSRGPGKRPSERSVSEKKDMEVQTIVEKDLENDYEGERPIVRVRRHKKKKA